MYESLRAKTPEWFIEDAKSRFQQALKHPLIPGAVNSRLQPLLKRIQLVSDEEYATYSRAIIDTTFNYDKERDADWVEGSPIGSLFLEDPMTKKPFIAIKKSFFDNDRLMVYETLPGFLSEELSHGYTKAKTISIADLPPKTLFYQPFNNKEELLTYISNAKTEVATDLTQLNESDLIAKIWGFDMTIIDTKDNLEFKHNNALRVLEETRVKVLRGIFEAIMIGQKKHSAASPTEQFNLGLKFLASSSSDTILAVWPPVNKAAIFLEAYFKKDKMIKPQIARLFELLYDNKIDDFFGSISDNTSEGAMNELLKVTSEGINFG